LKKYEEANEGLENNYTRAEAAMVAHQISAKTSLAAHEVELKVKHMKEAILGLPNGSGAKQAARKLLAEELESEKKAKADAVRAEEDVLIHVEVMKVRRELLNYLELS